MATMRHDGETAAVAQAVEQHYWPRFAGDDLPADNIGACAGTGRQAGNTGRHLGHWPAADWRQGPVRPAAAPLWAYCASRWKPAARWIWWNCWKSPKPASLKSNWLTTPSAACSTSCSTACATTSPAAITLPTWSKPSSRRSHAASTRCCRGLKRYAFRALPEAEALAAANKRISNILKKTEVAAGGPDFALLQEDAEKVLFEALSLARQWWHRIWPTVITPMH